MKDGSVCTPNQVSRAIMVNSMIEAVPLMSATLLVPKIEAKAHLGCAPEHIEPPQTMTTMEKVGAFAADLTKELTKEYVSGRMGGV